ncbi:dapper 1-B [Chanos chanos]|uniref:Dapper 1-B n=1 Tax=Chanos chanos TaxID=29144 RepID=A0A6J2UP56_CHACN|nr:dapper 1-B-like [Chanos chanos]
MTGIKDRLQASLTWLCELELLKQRQESLVLCALSLGDTVPGCTVWGDLQLSRSAHSREQEDLTLRRQLNRLQGAPRGLMLALQQQLSELRLDTEVTYNQNPEEDIDSPLSSGFYEQSESLSPSAYSCSSQYLGLTGHRPRSVDAYMLDWEGDTEPPPRSTLPRSFSAPYSSLEGIAEGTEEEEDGEDGQEDEELKITQEAEEHFRSEGIRGPTMEENEDVTEEDIQQALRVEAYILGLLQRRALRSTHSSSPAVDPAAVPWHNSHIYEPCVPNHYNPPPDHPDWQTWAAENGPNGEEYQDPEMYYTPMLNSQSEPPSLSCEEPETSLELEYYGAPDPCVSSSETDSPQHHHSHYRRPDPPGINSLPKYIHTCRAHTCTLLHSVQEDSDQRWTPLSSEQALPNSMPRKFQMEQWASTSETHQRQTSRSQSEDSLWSRGSRGILLKHRYYTVDRGMGCHHGNHSHLHSSGQRRWSSSADLSQEEVESVLRWEPTAFGHTHLPYRTHVHTLPQYTGQNGRAGQGSIIEPTPGNGSDSSLSEAYSPASSSLSSDSDESSGLVWPQQLPPCLAPSSASSNLPPNSGVKIKASHALKKKIMRFRSGSLKMMTTV